MVELKFITIMFSCYANYKIVSYHFILIKQGTSYRHLVSLSQPSNEVFWVNM